MWELDYKESWVLKNLCLWTVVLEKTLESPSDFKEFEPVNPKRSLEHSLEGLILTLKLQYLATWCEELTHLKRPWYWERLKAGGEGDDRGWDHCIASRTQWTWVWINSSSWWWTRRPGVLQSMCKVLDTTERLNRPELSKGEKNLTLFFSSCQLRERWKNVWHFLPISFVWEPWPSCLLPSH